MGDTVDVRIYQYQFQEWISIKQQQQHQRMRTRGKNGGNNSEESAELKECSTEEELFRELEKDGGRKLSSSLALRKVHSFAKHQGYRDWFRIQANMQRILRQCKNCRKWDRMDIILTCQRCEDYYHSTCLPSRHPIQPFFCPPCKQTPPTASPCPLCRQPLQGKTAKCQYCLNLCHSQCLSKPPKSCNRCVDFRKHLGKRKQIRKAQKKVLGANRNLREMFEMMEEKGLVENSEQRLKRKGKGFKALVMKETQDIKQYRSSLLKAIKEKSMNYSEDLKNIEFHLNSLKDSMELGLANMSPAEEKEYKLYKQHPIGPFLVTKQGDKGYGVIADKDIPRYSIICEYVGEVVTLRQCEALDRMQGQENDSKMDLWIGKNSEEKLLIRPQKWTNIGRFLNGVKSSRSAKNVDSLRLCFRGLPLVLLYSNRDIKKGESLVYDYNAGGIEAKYDTSGFTE